MELPCVCCGRDWRSRSSSPPVLAAWQVGENLLFPIIWDASQSVWNLSQTNTKKRPSTILPRWRSSARSALAGSWMAGRRGGAPARTDVPYVPVRHQSGGVGPGGRSLPASQSSWEHVKLDQVTRSRSWAPTSTRGPSGTTGWWTGRGRCRRRRLCGAGSRTSSTNDIALPAGWNSPNRSWHGQPAL